MIKKLILFTLLSLCVALQASAWNPMITTSGGGISTPTFVVQATGSTNWGTTCTASLTLVAGSNRIIIAGGTSENETVDSATFGGTAQTGEVGTGVTQDTFHGGMFYYVVAAESGAIAVVITQSGASASACWAIQVDGVNTSDVVEDFDTDTGDAADTDVEMTVTPVNNNNLLVSMVGVQLDSRSFVVCNSTGQTLLAEKIEGGSQTIGGGYFDLSTAAAKNQCFDVESGLDDVIGITVAINPAGS